MKGADAPGSRLLHLWDRLSPWPGGRWLFSRLVGRMAPYSGTLGARVRTLEPGHCVVELRDRRRVRNHLDSIHAVALANLGELTTGLATVTALPQGIRGIVVRVEAEYTKKARGRIVASCRTEVGPVPAPRDELSRADLRDESGDLVATVRATWRVAPRSG